MLKVQIKVKDKVHDVPNPLPGTMGGSMTDLTNGVREIINWMPQMDGTIKIMRSTFGFDRETPLIRETIPLEEMTMIKHLQKGETFELPIKSVNYGDIVLIYDNR